MLFERESQLQAVVVPDRGQHVEESLDLLFGVFPS